MGDPGSSVGRRVPRGLLGCGTVALVLLSALAGVGRAAAATPTWAAAGPGTVTLVSDGSAAAPQFSYDALDGQDSQFWTFSTTSAGAGMLDATYDFRGFHAYNNVVVVLRAFVTRAGTTTTRLVVGASGNCCSPPSGGFAYAGTTTFDLQAGDVFGFRVGAGNADSNRTLRGSLTVSGPGITPPEQTTLVADAPEANLFTLRARLTRTAGSEPIPGQTVVMSTSTGESCRADTDADGVATCSGLGSALPIAAEGGYVASFSGTTTLTAATAGARLVTGGRSAQADPPSTTATTGATTTTTPETTTTTTTPAGVLGTTATTAPSDVLPATGGGAGGGRLGGLVLAAGLALAAVLRHVRANGATVL